jgi:hypothetical protein
MDSPLNGIFESPYYGCEICGGGTQRAAEHPVLHVVDDHVHRTVHRRQQVGHVGRIL